MSLARDADSLLEYCGLHSESPFRIAACLSVFRIVLCWILRKLGGLTDR